MHILVVDDDLNIRTRLVAALRELGHAVDEAEDGFVAMRRAESTNFDLIITDFRMPRMSGVDLIIETRMELPKPPRIWLMSGDIIDTVRDYAIKRGAEKVFDKVELFRQLKSLLPAEKNE